MTMQRKTWISIAAIACAATAAIAQQRPASTTTTRPAGASTLPADHYNVVVERNIFVRDRRKPVVASTRTTRPATPPPSLESTLVLRGVVLEEGAFRAYFENTSANELLRVAAGDALAKGHVVEISIDAVAFESANGLVWVKVGDNLVGSRIASADPTPASTSPTGPGPAGESDVARRMRERREQQQQQRGGGRR